MKPARVEALQSLVPNCSFAWVGDEYSGLDWTDERTKPTEDEINAEIKRLQDEYDAQEYARKREVEYPSIADQLDEIYHNGIDSWKAVIKVTKDKHPKG